MSAVASEIKILKECTGDDFFKSLEKHIDSVIPVNVKKFLALNSYDNCKTLSEFDTNSIEEIESFMRCDFSKDMIEVNETINDYLGVFSKCQPNFKVLSGQSKIMKYLGKVCRELYGTQSTSKLVSSEFYIDDSTQPHAGSIQKEFFNTIGAHMISVFNDAKRVTLSAWSWPSRVVTSNIAHDFKITGTSSNNLHLQYVTPTNHAKFIACIVQSDLERLRELLKSALAVSLRVDGSCDRTQEHNLYILVNVINADATNSTLFLGFGTPESSNTSDTATEYFNCLKETTKHILPWETFLKLLTSMCTDGENLNMGRLNGLCIKVKQARLASNSPQIPFEILWCIGHRINLSWQSVCRMPIISTLIKQATKLSTHFRRSAKKTLKLRKIAAVNHFRKPLRYPAYFAVRWGQFTHSLLNACLRNWRTSIKYFESQNLTAQKNRWTSYDKIHLFTFLTDLLGLLKSFQKKCQSDSISILDIVQMKNDFMQELMNCKAGSVEGGWEENFRKEQVNCGNSVYLHGIKLKKSGHNSYSFNAPTRIKIVDKLIQHLTIRLGLDDQLQKALGPLSKVCITASLSELKTCHATIIPDLDEIVFYEEYYEAAHLLQDYTFKTTLETLQKLQSVCPNGLPVLKRALARVAAAKPHSADVERLISAYNSPAALFDYLYINYNMGPVEEFDPKPATKYWFKQKKRSEHANTKCRQQDWFRRSWKSGKVPSANNRILIVECI